jgi:HAD superfamily hydrolase (TIGR01490 family)
MDPAKQKRSKRLVLFDFDGTLTRGDTFGAFLLFAVPWGKLLAGVFLLVFRLPALLFLEKDERAERAKAAILQIYFGGKSHRELQGLGSAFYEKRLTKMLRQEILDMLRSSRLAGDTVAVVSASMDIWLRPFCESEHIILICTELEYKNGIFQGSFSTPNCNRQQKARRIREAFQLTDFQHVVAYGNSAGDYAMFELAQEAWNCRGETPVKFQTQNTHN